MAQFTPKYSLYKWGTSDEKLVSFTESAKNADKLETELSKLDERVTTAQTKANAAGNDATSARITAESADATASEAKALAQSAEATANTADQTASEAITLANDAKSTSDTVKSQFDQVVAEAGSNNPEVVQARGSEVNLNARLNKVDTRLADMVTQIDGIGDGIANDYTSFNNAVAKAKKSKTKILDLGSDKIYYLDGEPINLNGLKVIGNNIIIQGNGQKIFEVSGSIGTFTNLNSDVIRGSYTIDSSLATSLKVGDLVKIISDKPFTPAEPTRVQGEMHIVKGITGNIITFYDMLFDSYSVVNNARVAKVTPTSIEISRGITIKNIGLESTDFGLYIKLALRPLVECSFESCAYSSVTFDDCYSPVANVLVNNSSGTGTGYGVCINNATMFAKITGDIFWCRHAVAHGGNTSGGVAWESKVTVNSSTVLNLGGSAAFDAHPSTGSVHWENCTSFGGKLGIKLNARYNYVRNYKARTTETNSGLFTVSNIPDLSVDTVDISDAIGSGYTSLFENYMPIANLKINEISVDGVGILIRANVTNWDFSNIKAKKQGIVIYDTANIIPEKLNITNLKVAQSELADINYYGVYNYNANLKQIILKDCGQTRMAALLRSATNLDSIEMYNCESIEPYSSHIYMDTLLAGRLVVVGGVYKDNQRNGNYFGCLFRGNVTEATVQGITTRGNNFNYIFYGTIGTILHNGNNFHAVTLVGGSTALQVLGGSLNAPRVLAGIGTPESVITAPIGTLYTRLDGGVGTTLYIKESGTGNTGWIAK